MAKIPFTIEAWLKDKSQKVFDNKGNELVICSFEFTSNKPYIHAYEKKNDCGRKGYKLDEVFFRSEPELTDWQRLISACLQKHGLLDCGAADRIAKESATELLSLAREQFIKDGYVIEKKAFHDAVEKVDPEVMKEVSENVDKLSKEGLTEFEIAVKSWMGVAEDIVIDDSWVRNCAKELLALALKQLQPEIDAEIKKAYKNADDVQYRKGFKDGKAEALKDLPMWIPNHYSDDKRFNIEWRKGCPFICYYGKLIALESFTKLPGFKED